MKILIANNEQAPWRFSKDVTAFHVPLETGDYTIQGFEHSVVVERKSLDDLVKTVIHDWLRFTKQLRRMAAFDVAMIVVEAPFTALMDHEYESKANPNSVQGKLNAIFVRFGVPTVFLDNRTLAANFVENLFNLYLEERKSQ